tara:strand:+ start:775 stop:957 length:183 start_codon:yes stop_codon:yes gene_type:complete
MELKKYIESTAKLIIPSIDHIQLVEYKNKELDFVYGMQEYHTSFKRMFKQIKRIICQLKK